MCRPVCKVADFGLARERAATFVSGVSSQRGTLPWTAPEIIRTPLAVTHKARSNCSFHQIRPNYLSPTSNYHIAFFLSSLPFIPPFPPSLSPSLLFRSTSSPSAS
jgi:hypothetical protein